MKDFSFSCRRLLPQNIERIRELLNYVDIIEKNIYNIDSKICGIIDDYCKDWERWEYLFL